ncbi:hypothetical protein DL96DRAFT_1560974 [Flagelloscypha sp. PMI_526]|nr:hypothetical protein DL96DRAFT_1560974 [Flagelloscypha sp. PMI_526]
MAESLHVATTKGEIPRFLFIHTSKLARSIEWMSSTTAHFPYLTNTKFSPGPDGQTAFRLVRDNGHAIIAAYLPVMSLGRMRRVQNRSRTTVLRLKQMGAAVFPYTLIAFLQMPKFSTWTLPKQFLEIIYRMLSDADTVNQFSRFILRKVPIFVFWHLPKVLPFVLKELSKSIWEVVSVDIPRVLKHFTPEFGKPCLVRRYLSHPQTFELLDLASVVGLKLGHAAQAFVFAIHTAIRVTISFFRAVTLKDIWNGVLTIFEILFVDISLLLW